MPLLEIHIFPGTVNDEILSVKFVNKVADFRKLKLVFYVSSLKWNLYVYIYSVLLPFFQSHIFLLLLLTWIHYKIVKISINLFPYFGDFRRYETNLLVAQVVYYFHLRINRNGFIRLKPKLKPYFGDLPTFVWNRKIQFFKASSMGFCSVNHLVDNCYACWSPLSAKRLPVSYSINEICLIK